MIRYDAESGSAVGNRAVPWTGACAGRTLSTLSIGQGNAAFARCSWSSGPREYEGHSLRPELFERKMHVRSTSPSHGSELDARITCDLSKALLSLQHDGVGRILNNEQLVALRFSCSQLHDHTLLLLKQKVLGSACSVFSFKRRKTILFLRAENCDRAI